MTRIAKPAQPRASAAPAAGDDHDEPGPGDDPFVHRVVPAGTAARRKPANAASSVFEQARLTAAAARASARQQQPTLDPDSIPIEHGVPVPKPRLLVNGAYERLFARFPVGASILLPRLHAKRVQTFAVRNGIRLTVRQIDAQQSRVWRIEGAPATRRKKPTTAGGKP